MQPSPESPRARIIRRHWPWIVLALALVPAIGYLAIFPSGVDREFPEVVRPTFSAYPPAAYRVAEPGDTLDRIAMYLASGAVALSIFGVTRRRAVGPGGSLWIAALGVSLVSFWSVTNPWPTFDGWHGLGWRVVFDSDAPDALRGAIAVAGLALLGMIAVGIRGVDRAWPLLMLRAKRSGILPMLVVAGVLASLRALEWPATEPRGFWTRWAAIGAAWLWLAALIRMRPSVPTPRIARVGTRVAVVGGTVGLIVVGLTVFWYHRPLERFRAIDPGKIYISAMPHGEGLEVLHRRHGFKTIINLFQEDLPGLRSPHLDAEIAFAQAHDIHFIRSPVEASKAEAFMDETLRLANDPEAWPILLHCHACMDRTPAWWGIYQFVVKERPLIESLQAIEQHRGSRPKGSVTLLYNRVLARLAPDRHRADPTAALLQRYARGTPDPFEIQLERERQLAQDDQESAPKTR
ncbi:fused DSP-PTPase phosphatase/NAD kinase-like protein [Tautonia marina]|uniref:fused DSP-PTPase phosphatase/NAD kinase-like protein n=1 Tax=Tautonia marina TaxID=2653855 RepID=UPI0012611E9F|nr:protein tyrosine phosphatase [Tautonia marina]